MKSRLVCIWNYKEKISVFVLEGGGQQDKSQRYTKGMSHIDRDIMPVETTHAFF
jgi:hypothetical protein